jgi:7-carboxy-7-deazaguanine synthase
LYNDKVSAFNFIACSPKKQMNDGRSSYKQFASLPQTFFKFVYENKNDAWWVSFMKENDIDKSRVWIMPEGSTREEQISKMPEVIEYCLENKFHFSPRLHILAYDTKRGV